MTISNKMRQQMLKLCGSISEDDGQDPRKLSESKTTRKSNDEYRHERLCRQVARTLELVLPESLAEPIRDLKIDRVVRGRNTSVLKVKIAEPKWADRSQQTELMDLVKSQEGWLRSEVAAAITRKRVPRLSFEFTESVIDAEEASHEQ